MQALLALEIEQLTKQTHVCPGGDYLLAVGDNVNVL